MGGGRTLIVFPCEKPEGNDTPRQNVLENGSLAANPEFLSLPLFKYLVFGTGSRIEPVPYYVSYWYAVHNSIY
jgi:hypothetical protein